MKKGFLFLTLIALLLISFAGVKADQNIIISTSKTVISKQNLAEVYFNTIAKANCKVFYGAKSDLSDAVSVNGLPGAENTETTAGEQLYLATLFKLSPGENYYQISCVTDNGNSEKSSIMKLNNSAIDTSQMIIDGVRATNVTDTSANIYIETSNNYKCRVDYADLAKNAKSVTSVLEQSANSGNGGYFVYTAKLTNLQASTRYNYKVICLDSSNKVKESEYYGFYTTMNHAKVVISNVKLTHTSQNAVKINWETNIETSYNYVMFYGQKARTGQAYYEDKHVFKKNHEVIISGFPIDDSYEYSIYSGLVENSTINAITKYFTVSPDDKNVVSTSSVQKIDKNLVKRLSGKIVLQTESHGEAYYINPKDGKGYYMADGNAAYNIMRNLGIGITNKDLDKIKSDVDYRKKYIGKIFLQVESKGEAYYISSNGRYNYLKDGAAAYNVMRSLGLGITNIDLNKIPVKK